MSQDTVNQSSPKVDTARTDRQVLEMLRAQPGYEDLTRSQAQRLLKSGWVYDRGQVLHAKSRIAPGALLEVRRPDREERAALTEETAPLEILFEDEDLAIINKPVGLVVHQDHRHDDHVSIRLSRQLGSLSRLFEDRPGIVHRLDKDTTGTLVVAKTDRAHVGLAKLFSEHTLIREYVAFVYGVPHEERWTLDNRLARDLSDRKRMGIVRSRTGGRRAISHFVRTEVYGSCASQVRVRLETGRTHQVRVHATASGHSILGDPTYGLPSSRQAKFLALPDSLKSLVRALPGQALHAERLEFKHPITEALVSVRAAFPAHLAALQEALRGAACS